MAWVQGYFRILISEKRVFFFSFQRVRFSRFGKISLSSLFPFYSYLFIHVSLVSYNRTRLNNVELKEYQKKSIYACVIISIGVMRMYM